MTDDLRSLAHDLAEAPAKAQRETVAIVEHGAHNVKEGWAENARASSGHHAPAYPASISYDMVLGSGLSPAAVIGPDKARRQGALGNILEFGSPRSAPHNDGGRALAKEAPNFERAIAAAALDALGWH